MSLKSNYSYGTSDESTNTCTAFSRLSTRSHLQSMFPKKASRISLCFKERTSMLIRESKTLQEDLLLLEPESEENSFKNCPLIPNGTWAHVPLNWLSMMTSIIDVINSAIQANDITIIYQLQESQKEFYLHLVNSVSIPSDLCQRKSFDDSQINEVERCVMKLRSAKSDHPFEFESKEARFDADNASTKTANTIHWNLPPQTVNSTYFESSEVTPFHQLIEFMMSLPTVQRKAKMVPNMIKDNNDDEAISVESMSIRDLLRTQDIDVKEKNFKGLLESTLEYAVLLDAKVNVEGVDKDDAEFNTKFVLENSDSSDSDDRSTDDTNFDTVYDTDYKLENNFEKLERVINMGVRDTFEEIDTELYNEPENLYVAFLIDYSIKNREKLDDTKTNYDIEALVIDDEIETFPGSEVEKRDDGYKRFQYKDGEKNLDLSRFIEDEVKRNLKEMDTINENEETAENIQNIDLEDKENELEQTEYAVPDKIEKDYSIDIVEINDLESVDDTLNTSKGRFDSENLKQKLKIVSEKRLIKPKVKQDLTSLIKVRNVMKAESIQKHSKIVKYSGYKNSDSGLINFNILKHNQKIIKEFSRSNRPPRQGLRNDDNAVIQSKNAENFTKRQRSKITVKMAQKDEKPWQRLCAKTAESLACQLEQSKIYSKISSSTFGESIIRSSSQSTIMSDVSRSHSFRWQKINQCKDGSSQNLVSNNFILKPKKLDSTIDVEELILHFFNTAPQSHVMKKKHIHLYNPRIIHTHSSLNQRKTFISTLDINIINKNLIHAKGIYKYSKKLCHCKTSLMV